MTLELLRQMHLQELYIWREMSLCRLEECNNPIYRECYCERIRDINLVINDRIIGGCF